MQPDRTLEEALAGKRVAVVHEWVSAYAGSEQVFEAIAQLVPQADLYALSVEPGVNLDVGGRKIRTTVLDRPALRNRRGLTLPLMPLAWRLLGKGDYDVVITSHHAFAHTNRLTTPGGTHLVYVHSPARYVWSPEIDQRGVSRWLTPVRAVLKWIDKRATRRVTAYAANSTAVAERIKRFWDHDATIIFPPVRVEFFSEPSNLPPTRDYVLGFGRWIPYKNMHLVVEAADIAGLPVKIAGRGPDRTRIDEAAAKATVPIEIIPSPSDHELRELYRNAICLVFPADEDFGIVPVEAQATGTPVVALASGGGRDTVKHRKTGLLLDIASPPAIAESIVNLPELNHRDCQSNARQFNKRRFRHSLLSWTVTAMHANGSVQNEC